MGFWDEVGNGILGFGKPLTGIGIGLWILVGIGIAVCIAVLLMRI